MMMLQSRQNNDHTAFAPSVVFALTFCNLLVFIDRGIIPGSSNEFNSFISETLRNHRPDFFLGILQSSFVLGYAVASLIFALTARGLEPFLICASGISVWIVALSASGASFYLQSYNCLLLSRMLSGFGEAAMQFVVPSWIAVNAPVNERSIWLSIFYASIPLGNSIGYGYSAAISTYCGWQWSFIFGAIIMVPAIPFLLSLSVASRSIKIRPEMALSTPRHSPRRIKAKLLAVGAITAAKSGFVEMRTVLSQPVYLSLVLAMSAQAFALAGLGTFGSAFLLQLGFFDTELQASLVFGLICSLVGIVATPLGGLMVSQLVAVCRMALEEQGLVVHEDNIVVQQASKIAMMNVGLAGFLFAALFFAETRWLFLLLVSTALGAVLLCYAGVGSALMASVEPSHRAAAAGLGSLLVHVLGDVPGPMIAGLLKDSLVPNCPYSNSNSCPGRVRGVHLTLLLISSGLLPASFGYSIAWIFSLKKNGAGELDGPLLDATDRDEYEYPEELEASMQTETEASEVTVSACSSHVS